MNIVEVKLGISIMHMPFVIILDFNWIKSCQISTSNIKYLVWTIDYNIIYSFVWSLIITTKNFNIMSING